MFVITTDVHLHSNHAHWLYQPHPQHPITIPHHHWSTFFSTVVDDERMKERNLMIIYITIPFFKSTWQLPDVRIRPYCLLFRIVWND